MKIMLANRNATDVTPNFVVSHLVIKNLSFKLVWPELFRLLLGTSEPQIRAKLKTRIYVYEILCPQQM